MVFEVVSNAGNLYSKVKNPELMTENRKQTFGEKRNLVGQFLGEENRYEMQVWAYPEIQTKWDKNGRKTLHMIRHI